MYWKKKRGVKYASYRGNLHGEEVTWPPEVVYMAEGKPAAYQDISAPLFVKGYLITMDTQDSSVKHKMGIISRT